jgi:uncharacterized repeat protein (TIGR03837 family)
MNLTWNIFCRVIDNFGDSGVCWRLAVNLAERGQSVRLWVDDASALTWMAPEPVPQVHVLPWTTPFDMSGMTPGDVLIEAFGCEIALEFIAAYADGIRAGGQKCLWINLEYLTAENYAAKCHGLPSPVTSGPGKGLTKHFFYPGFTSGTGGLLRETHLLERQAQFDKTAWLAHYHTDGQEHSRVVSLFCYEGMGLRLWLDALAHDAAPTLLLVSAGQSTRAVCRVLGHEMGIKLNRDKRGALSISYLPLLSQLEFDHLLWACDLNFVRGEDSLVRALWAGKPFVWQIYPQDDGAHHAKLYAFLDWLKAPPSLRLAHDVWNGLAQGVMHWPAVTHWQSTVTLARQRLWVQDDLADALLQFVLKSRHG